MNILDLLQVIINIYRYKEAVLWYALKTYFINLLCIWVSILSSWQLSCNRSQWALACTLYILLTMHLCQAVYRFWTIWHSNSYIWHPYSEVYICFQHVIAHIENPPWVGYMEEDGHLGDGFMQFCMRFANIANMSINTPKIKWPDFTFLWYLRD